MSIKVARAEAWRVIEPLRDAAFDAADAWRRVPLTDEEAAMIDALQGRAEALITAHVAAEWPVGTDPRDVYEYRDNFRAADVSDAEQVARYAARWAAGCCGGMDLLIDGFLFGFNYGH